MSESFDNPHISVASLPSLSDANWQALSPRHLREVLVGRVGVALMGAIAATANLLVGPGSSLGWLAPVLLGVLLLVVLGGHALIAVPRKAYAVRQHDLLFRTGWILQSMTAVPLNRVQHIEVRRGPLERSFDLATLQIFTAGGSGSDLSVPGMDTARADALREYILGRIGQEPAKH